MKKVRVKRRSAWSARCAGARLGATFMTLALASCGPGGADNFEAEGGATSWGESSSEITATHVRLIYAEPFVYAAGGLTWNQTNIFVHAKNVGTDAARRVYVHYDDGPSWQDVEMQLVGSYGTHSTYQYTFPNSQMEFVLKYDTSVGTFWDNNDGANYKVRSWFGADDFVQGKVGYDVGLVSANLRRTVDRGSGTIHYIVSGEIAVQNTAYHKRVGMRIQVDGAWTDVLASYAYTMSTGGAYKIEIWRLEATVESVPVTTPLPPLPTFQFAVFYQENPASGGPTRWDNDFGQDYFLTNSLPAIR